MPAFSTNFSKQGVFLTSLAFAVLLGLGLTFYHLTAVSAQSQNAEMPPPPRVEVIAVERQQIRPWAEFSGRLTAVDSAEIKPLVGGTIQRVLFQDGDLVSQGQALFLIDPRPHQAEVKLAEAQLVSARAREKLAKDERTRAQRLVQDKLISSSDFDRAVSEAAMAEAAVAQAEAQLQQAKLDLEYAHISAPVAGRISRAELTVGNVVEAGANAPVLASIVANQSLYAEFNVDEQTYISFMRTATRPQEMPVHLVLTADQSVVYEGHLHAFDNRLDSASGTIRARAIFQNTDGALTPGMYATVRLGAPDTRAALLVPERAIGTNQNRKFVLVVDENNVAQYREVGLGNQWRGQRVIESGLSVGERIIVNGMAHVRPSTPVAPMPAANDLMELGAPNEEPALSGKGNDVPAAL